MPTLIFRGTDGEQRLELESELSVGREAGNDVVLKDSGVSRKHCRFFVDEGGVVWVEDLGSANGVTVGGERIGDATEVADGVEVVVGGCKVKLAPKRAAAGPRSTGAARPAAAKSVALAKPVRSTRMMTAAESPKRARPVSKAPPRGTSGSGDGRPALRGMAGPFADLAYDLDRPKLMVGRVPPADIVVDDDSVSRRHAEIVKIGPRFSVRDLGSANGTFLNGDRVSEAPLSPGDVVRFGVVEMAFSGPASAKAKPAGLDKKKKFMIIGGAGGALLIIIIIIILAAVGGGSGSGSGKNPQPNPDEKPPEEDPAKLMGKCRYYSDTDADSLNWNEAAKFCEKVYQLDPTIPDAKKLSRQAKKELEFEKIVADAKQRLATSQEDTALKVLLKVEKDSSTFSQARKVFKEASDLLFKRSRNACKGAVTSGNFESAIPDCKRALELSCNLSEGADPEVMGWFQHACKQSGTKPEYTCPPEYNAFQGGGLKLIDPAIQAEQAIRARYTDGQVANLMVAYYKEGRAKKTALALTNMRSRNPKMAKDLNDLIQSLNVIDGRYATGQGSLLRGQPLEAETLWKDVFENEARILPPNVQSVLTKELHVELGKEFFKLGRNEFNREHYEKSFANVYKCYKHDPRNIDCASAVAQMEREADRKMSDEPGCDSYISAMAITAPDSRAHKKAEEAAKKNNCQ